MVKGLTKKQERYHAFFDKETDGYIGGDGYGHCG